MTLVEHYRQEGIQQGIDRGRHEGAVQTLLAQLTRKFGELDHTQDERVRYASEKELAQWTLNILDAKSIEEVFVEK